MALNWAKITRWQGLYGAVLVPYYADSIAWRLAGRGLAATVQTAESTLIGVKNRCAMGTWDLSLAALEATWKRHQIAQRMCRRTWLFYAGRSEVY